MLVVNFCVTDIISRLICRIIFSSLKDEDIDGEIEESGNENTEATSSNGTKENAKPNDLDVAEAGCSSESPATTNTPKFHTACDCDNSVLNMSPDLNEDLVADTAM